MWPVNIRSWPRLNPILYWECFPSFYDGRAQGLDGIQKWVEFELSKGASFYVMCVWSCISFGQEMLSIRMLCGGGGDNRLISDRLSTVQIHPYIPYMCIGKALYTTMWPHTLLTAAISTARPLFNIMHAFHWKLPNHLVAAVTRGGSRFIFDCVSSLNVHFFSNPN